MPARLSRLVRFMAVIIVAGGLLLPVGTRAQVPVERIVSFDSQITLSRDNVVSFHESIDYDFGLTPRHGIYRYVPTEYGDRDGHTFYLSLAVKGVTDERGKGLHYERGTEGPNVFLKIGDADKTITGRHIYVISYELMPVVRQGAGTDLLTLNVTGNGWKVPIEQANAKLILPSGVTLLANRCFTGLTGLTTGHCTITPTAAGYVVALTKPLAVSEGLTLASDLPTGSVTRYLEANQRPPIRWSNYFGALTAAGLAALSLLWLVLSWIRYRVARSRQTIVPAYEPPDKLMPAELGYLTDNRSNMTEVTATLIDLAVRGWLNIEQTAPKKLLTKAKYRLTKQKEGKGLQNYEQELFNALFASGKSITLDELDRTKMATATSRFRDQLKSTLDAKGYYAKPARHHRWLKGAPWIIGSVVWLAVLVIHLVAGTGGGAILWNMVATTAGLIALGYVILRKRSTAAGVSEWAEVEGFKWWLSMTEKERLKFTDAPERTPKLFSAMLPAAVALGVEKQWAKQFEGIDVAKDTNWYVGNQVFTSYALAGDLRSGFAGAVSSNFASVSSSSGGSSGSFSGGGFGGGGGGSW